MDSTHITARVQALPTPDLISEAEGYRAALESQHFPHAAAVIGELARRLETACRAELEYHAGARRIIAEQSGGPKS